MFKYLLSAFADEYSANFREQCEGLRKFSIDNMELRGVNNKNISVLNKSEISEVSKTLKEYGITVSSIGSPLGKIKINGNLIEHRETAKRVFEAAALLGARYVRIFSFYSPVNSDIYDFKGKIFNELYAFCELADEFDIALCHENECGIFGESPERCLELLNAFGGKIKCVFDMGNFVLDGYEPLKAYNMLKSHIAYFHIKDSLYKGAVVPAGKGDARIKEILADYKVNMQNDTFISLEPHLQTFSGLNELTDKSFDNPYKYANQKEAFKEAVKCFMQII